MRLKESLPILLSIFIISCWKYPNDNPPDYTSTPPLVWGYKPVYGTEAVAKKISYTSVPQPVISGGNIYAFNKYIFQVETGLGIHVIDNSVSSAAARVGFIHVKGCSEISIKGDKLYTNSYDDLIVVDFSDLNNVREYSRLKGVFTEYKYGSPIAQPPASGYYECPDYEKFVVGWTKDSVYQSCFKN
jgi:hypothetical protein